MRLWMCPVAALALLSLAASQRPVPVRQRGRSTPAGQTPAVIDPPRPVRLREQAATHLAEKCQRVN